MPSSYEMGDGAVNFYLAILRQAKADYDNFIFQKNEMWHTFLKTEFYKQGGNVDPVEVAWWVANYIGG